LVPYWFQKTRGRGLLFDLPAPHVAEHFTTLFTTPFRKPPFRESFPLGTFSHDLASSPWIFPSLGRTSLFHPQCFERRIAWVGVETRLKFCEQFTRNCRYVADACHRQQQTFPTGVESHLQGLGQILNRRDVPAETHASEHHQLGLDRLAEDARAQRSRCAAHAG